MLCKLLHHWRGGISAAFASRCPACTRLTWWGRCWGGGCPSHCKICKNAKKYRKVKNRSAGGAPLGDIAPYIDPKFEKQHPRGWTQTERPTMTGQRP